VPPSTRPRSASTGPTPSPPSSGARVTRRRALALGLGAAAGLVVAGAVGIELVSHGVLPGRSVLDELDGACDVAVPNFEIRGHPTSRSGSFYSQFRRQRVGYTIGLPPGAERGAELPLVVMLHGFGGNHLHALASLTPAQAVSLVIGGRAIGPMGLVTVDGGGGYWHPHPGDDPMGMVIHELIPRMQSMGLGRAPGSIGTMGISMGGYGALLLAERYPHLISAAAAISPAIWTTYAQARSVNVGAFDSAAQFARYDVITQSASLAGTPVRIASGDSDPFHPGVVALASRLGDRATVVFSGGCHTAPFFASQEPTSLEFLSQHLRARTRAS
jgi:predicted esterase